jgi:hypothetical protein
VIKKLTIFLDWRAGSEGLLGEDKVLLRANWLTEASKFVSNERGRGLNEVTTVHQPGWGVSSTFFRHISCTFTMLSHAFARFFAWQQRTTVT